VRDSVAVTSIFPFLNAIKAAHPGEVFQLDQLVQAQGIAPVSGDFGAGETNDAGDPDVLPIHAPLSVNGAFVNLCSTNAFESFQTGSPNKLGSRRLLRFTPPAAGPVTITVTALSIPAGAYADPDFRLSRQGLFGTSGAAPTALCEDNATGSNNPGSCVETASIALPATEHVLEIYEWTNTNDTSDPEFPPIGKTCFEVKVTQP
jgi:hypothetical protein